MQITSQNKNTDGEGQDSKKRSFEGFRKPRPSKDLRFDYKDPGTLRKYVTEHGRIVPRRITRLNAQQQNDLTTAIKRAQTLALLGYTGRDVEEPRRPRS